MSKTVGVFKLGLVGCLSLSLSACVVVVPSESRSSHPAAAMPTSMPVSMSVSNARVGSDQACVGTNDLPAELRGHFVEVQDPALLAQAVQAPSKGGLCQAKVYQSQNALTIYRAWNSANPNSRLGSWWAFEKASGSVSQYRRDYEICTQYSPLDRLAKCRLKVGTKIVVGTGQSAQCDAYLTYPASASRQIYMPKETASSALDQCQDFEAEFAWKTPMEPRSAEK